MQGPCARARAEHAFSANELFDIVTNFASGEEEVSAIFDGDKVKRNVDAPTEGSNSKNNSKKPKRGKKGKKKGLPNQRGQGHEEDSSEALIVTPNGKGPRGPP